MKLTCEVDTETKETKAWIDDQEVGLLEFSIGHYVYDTCDDKITNSTYVSITQGDVKNKKTYSISFSNGENSSYSESYSNISYAKDMEKVVKNIIASSILEKALNKNKF